MSQLCIMKIKSHGAPSSLGGGPDVQSTLLENHVRVKGIPRPPRHIAIAPVTWVCACHQGSTEGDFLAVAKAKGKGGKTSALKVKAEGLVFCMYLSIRLAYSDIGFERP